jgi:hypoxanthine phosphoribosyltransferase
MPSIKVLDKSFVPFISRDDIELAVRKVAVSISQDMAGKNPLFLVILNGSFVFAADLLRQLDFPLEVSFVKLSSYSGTRSTNTVRELVGLDKGLQGRHVVIVEDIIDTGVTMSYTLEKLRKLGVEDVRLATLLFKPDAFKKDYPIDYIGIEIPNGFIVGYGLDYDGYGRNLPDIWRVG